MTAKKYERLRGKALLTLSKVTHIGISERSLMQELLDNGASKREAEGIVQELLSRGTIKRETMGYLKVIL